MKNIDSSKHLLGQSQYLDDIPELAGTLYVGLYESSVAHGKIKFLDVTQAKSISGIVAVFTAKDIKGQNQIGGILPDEPLLAENLVEYIGQPIAVIYAESKKVIEQAIKNIRCEYEILPVIVDELEAYKQNRLLFPSRSIVAGDVKKSFDDKECVHRITGKARSGAQEHLYIETQGAYAVPKENDQITVYSSTQAPTSVQKTCAKVLGIGMHQLEVDVTRLGGGFGGKEDQANAVAVFCAWGAHQLKRPVKFILDRHEDMVSTGKRHPYSCQYKIGLNKNLEILAFEVEFYQNAGAFADLSPAIMERTLFHTGGAYFIPNLKTTVHACKTNIPPNTAFRGFGAPQAMFAIEAAIDHAAKSIGVATFEIQRKNMLLDQHKFHYGQAVKKSYLTAALNTLEASESLLQKRQAVEKFNLNNPRFKKGLSFFPLCFGISFTKSFMNQASSLVHIYQDGSIVVSTAAVEMGQGVNTKIVQIVKKYFQISNEKIKINSTNTYRIANTSPTAASSAADLNGKATELACQQLLDRIFAYAREKYQISDQKKLELIDSQLRAQTTVVSWEELIQSCFFARVNLSAHAFYATPNIVYDLQKEQGTPFAYHVYGVAASEVTVDCLLGTYQIDQVDIVHDFGQSMNLMIDIGQVEGALMQGIGWLTIEDIQYSAEGKNKAATLSAYKVPDLNFAPKRVNVLPVSAQAEPLAILGSKAVGEPPFMYGIGTYFALVDAIRVFNPQAKISYDAPLTPEKVLMALYG